MKKKGGIVSDTIPDWVLALIVLVVLVSSAILLKDKLEGYFGAIGDFFRVRR